MIKLRHIVYTIFATVGLLLLSGCKVAVLEPRGIIAAQEKELLIAAVLLMLIIVIPVLILIPIIATRYRASNKKAKHSPNWSHSTTLEFIWWLIPIIIIVILATMTWISTHELDPYKPIVVKDKKPITIQVVALRWKWLFIYPKQHIATVNYVQFPVNTPINFLITSDAPMNSFQIQQLAGQIYAMNGMQTKLHMMGDTIGDYNGRSVSFSGEGFTNMKFKARVSSEKDFNQWVQTIKQSPKTLTMQGYNELEKPSEDVPPMYYGKVVDKLYHMVIMKFMRPDMHKVNTSELGVHL